MQGNSIIIHADGSIERACHTEVPTLEFVQGAVGGYIEIVPYFNTIEVEGVVHTKCVAFCNEEGKLNGLPFNAKAQAAWNKAVGALVRDKLVGSVLILYGDDEFLDGL